MFIQMTTTKPIKPGTYLLQATWEGKPNKFRNSRVADISQLGTNGLMVYCLDIGVHNWLDRLPNNWRWSVEPIHIENDTRLN